MIIGLAVAVVALAFSNLYTAYALQRLWRHMLNIANSQQQFNNSVCEALDAVIRINVSA